MADTTIIDGVDYGPLAQLVGRWSGDKGLDISPGAATEKQTAFSEIVMFEAIGTIINSGRQRLSALHYHLEVARLGTDDIFHNESGYWLWDAENEVAIQTLTIPRGVALVAGGRVTSDANRIEVVAASDNLDFGIVQSPFMRENAKTVSFRHSIEGDGETMRYEECTVLEIYGRRFNHTDANTLSRTQEL